MRITIATVEKVAAVMYIASQRAMGMKPQPFIKLGAEGRVMYRVEARAALRALAPQLERAERQAVKRYVDSRCCHRNKARGGNREGAAMCENCYNQL